MVFKFVQMVSSMVSFKWFFVFQKYNGVRKKFRLQYLCYYVLVFCFGFLLEFNVKLYLVNTFFFAGSQFFIRDIFVNMNCQLNC